VRLRRVKTVKTKDRSKALKITSALLFANAFILFPFLFPRVEGTVSFWDILATINIVMNVPLIIALCALGALHSAHRQALKTAELTNETSSESINKHAETFEKNPTVTS
jgi:hypothetical protein